MSKNRVSFVMRWIQFNIIVLQRWLRSSIVKFTAFICAYFVRFALLDSSKICWKPLVIIVPFLSFKGTTHAYLLWISVIHNKNIASYYYSNMLATYWLFALWQSLVFYSCKPQNLIKSYVLFLSWQPLRTYFLFRFLHLKQKDNIAY